MEPLILSIDTSCDETSASVTCGRRVLSNVISSQINIHKKYGGVFPALAKRAHEEKIDFVVEEALIRAIRKTQAGQNVSRIAYPVLPLSAVAVTYGPGLAIALEVGIRKAKELVYGLQSTDYRPQTTVDGRPKTVDRIPLIAVNHMEGHIYSCLAQNAMGNPKREIVFPTRNPSPARNAASIAGWHSDAGGPARNASHSNAGGPALCLLVSGGHTELVLMTDHGKYKVLGSTLDDACGEALDKAVKILRLGYPGGPIIERLAEEYDNKKWEVGSEKIERKLEVRKSELSHVSLRYPASHLSPHTSCFVLSKPLKAKNNLNFSYSGLKTQFLYLVNSLSEKEFNKNLLNLAASFQSAAFEQLIRKTAHAIRLYNPKTLLCGGGVMANKYLRSLLRNLAKKQNLPIFFPPSKKLIGDNAAMIGVAAFYKFQRKKFVKKPEALDRIPRLSL